MGANLKDIRKQNQTIDRFLNGTDLNFFSTRFDSDYGLLMKAVEKITSLKFKDNCAVHFRTFGLKDIDGDDQYMVRIERHALFKGETLKEALYLSVVDFVERWT